MKTDRNNFGEKIKQNCKSPKLSVCTVRYNNRLLPHMQSDRCAIWYEQKGGNRGTPVTLIHNPF